MDAVEITQNSENKSGNPNLWFGLGAALTGILLSALLLPVVLPGLAFSASGSEPKFFWYLSRGTAIFSYLFLWLSLVLGISLTGKVAKYFPGAFTANDLHQFISITGLAGGLLHGLLLMGDRYIHFSLIQVLLPFSTANYRPFWVGIGQVGIYLWAILIGTFYLKKWIGYKSWRLIHLAGYLVFAGVMVHGITTGTDSGTPWMTAIYWTSGASILFLTFYRVIALAEAKTIPASNR
jgi:predicted ferric reductase